MPWARGGFLGVDAFFVLSGYLITSLLLTEWNARGGIGLLAFWTRRARRLLPALFLMLVGVAVYAAFFAGRLELGKIRDDAIATICYIANWRPVFTGQSYFDQFSMPSPLRHTWSLAIEEQYYLIWPLLLLFLLRVRRMSPEALLVATLVMVAGSALLMGALFQPGHDPSRVYYGTDTRAQSLLVGAALAMLLLRVGPLRDAVAGRLLQGVAVPCAVGIGFVWVTTSENDGFLFRGGFLLLALAVAVVIAAAVQPKAGPIGRVLSLPPLRALGLISYGVYLWHWPIYLMLTPARTGLTGWDGYELLVVRILATLAIATASYHLFEMPIRRGAFRRWRVSWALAPVGAVSIAVLIVFSTRGGFSPVSAPLEVAMPEADGVSGVQPVRVMIVGDSVGLSLEPGLTEVGRDGNLLIWNRSHFYCGFLPTDVMRDLTLNYSKDLEDRCKSWRKTWASDVEEFRPDVVVVLFGGWDYPDHVVNGVTLETGTPEWNAYVLSELETQFDVLTSKGAKLALVTWPYPKPTGWSALDAAAELEQDAHRRLGDLNSLYGQFAEQHPDKVSLVDLNGFACPEGRFTDLVVDGVKMRGDGVHFTPESSHVVARWLAPRIAETVGGLAVEPVPRFDLVGPPAPTRVMMVGDSEGGSMLPGLELLGGQQNLVIKDMTIAGCGFLDVDVAPDPYIPGDDMGSSEEQANRCKEWHKTWPAELEEFRPDVVIWVFGAWDGYTFGLNGRVVEAGTLEWRDYLMKGLEENVDLLSSGGAKFMLLTYPYYAPPWWSLFPNGDELEEDAKQRVMRVNDVYLEYVAQHPDKVALVDMNSYICPEGKATDIVIDGVRLREDGGHFTKAGSVVVARWLVPQISEAVDGVGPSR